MFFHTYFLWRCMALLFLKLPASARARTHCNEEVGAPELHSPPSELRYPLSRSAKPRSPSAQELAVPVPVFHLFVGEARTAKSSGQVCKNDRSKSRRGWRRQWLLKMAAAVCPSFFFFFLSGGGLGSSLIAAKVNAF